MSDKKSSYGLETLMVIVFAIFLTLKLAEVGMVKDWSWWWVFSPFWIYIGFMISLAILVFGWVILKDLLFGARSDKPRQNPITKKSRFQEKLEEIEINKQENKDNHE